MLLAALPIFEVGAVYRCVEVSAAGVRFEPVPLEQSVDKYLLIGGRYLFDPYTPAVMDMQEKAEVAFTAKEILVLKALARGMPLFCTYSEIVRYVWRMDIDQSLENTLKAHVSRIRWKLGSAAIETRFAYGYKLVASETLG